MTPFMPPHASRDEVLIEKLNVMSLPPEQRVTAQETRE
jgi:hypothetical protein